MAKLSESDKAQLRRPIPPGLWQDLKAEGLLDPGAPVPA